MVLRVSSGSRVAQRCSQTAGVGVSNAERTTATGRIIAPAINSGIVGRPRTRLRSARGA
ncbi:MAG: hypothetical protein DDT28_01189 [Dehalococcoidia bacterium]|nr:hypothetical protein [Chloroflexota bacterium]